MKKGRVTIRDNSIASVSYDGPVSWSDADCVIDLEGLTVAPGFLDLQLNGGLGKHFTDNPADVWQVGRFITRYGVTSFLACLVSAPPDVTTRSLAVVESGPPNDYRGARLLGLHLEGPYLNPHKKGAHNPNYLRPPDPLGVHNWSLEKGVRLVTLAPELPSCSEMIPLLTSRGVVVAAGHSAATYEQAMDSFDRGVRYGTHLFNAMPPLHHRQPGLAGALLDDERVCVGVVADGYHVHACLIRLAWDRLGGDRLNLVSDAMGALGMPPGEYQHYGLDMVVGDDVARLSDGTLAGSILSLDAAFRNLMFFTGCPPQDAIKTVTTTPARLLGLEQRQGAIRPGMIADLVILNQDFTIAGTLVEGELVYTTPLLQDRMIN